MTDSITNGPRPRRAIDLFAGAGGFSLGLQEAGFHVEHAVEVDPWAAETLAANHPTGVRVWARDIRGITDAEVKREFAPHPDLMVGGPPCQGFSHANVNNSDPKDPRNTLFEEFVRFAKLLEPRAVLMENVPGLIRSKTAEGRPVIEIIEEELRNIGYQVATRVVDASEYGVPQMRKRVFVSGCLDREIVPVPQPTHEHSSDPEHPSLFEAASKLPRPVTLWEALSDLPKVDVGEDREPLRYEQGPINNYQTTMREGSDVVWNHLPMRHSPRLVERFKQIKWGEGQAHVTDEHAPRVRNSNGGIVGNRYGQNNRRMRPDTICHTIPASFYANFLHPYLDRNFTAREGARIQSFPDRYVFKGKPTVVSQKLLAREGRHEELKLCQYNQIGNAVPPLLAKALASHFGRELGL